MGAFAEVAGGCGCPGASYPLKGQPWSHRKAVRPSMGPGICARGRGKGTAMGRPSLLQHRPLSWALLIAGCILVLHFPLVFIFFSSRQELYFHTLSTAVGCWPACIPYGWGHRKRSCPETATFCLSSEIKVHVRADSSWEGRDPPVLLLWGAEQSIGSTSEPGFGPGVLRLVSSCTPCLL